MTTQAIPDADTLPPLISPKIAAQYLGVSQRTVVRLIRSGDLMAKRVGKRLLRIDRNSLLKIGGAQ